MNKTNRLLSAMLPIMAAGMLMDCGAGPDIPAIRCVPGVRGKLSRLKKKKVKNYFVYYEAKSKTPKTGDFHE